MGCREVRRPPADVTLRVRERPLPLEESQSCIVASIVSRWAGQVSSHLIYGTGLIVVRMDSAYYVAKVIAAIGSARNIPSFTD
jgi:hypothetical protein